MKSRINPTGLFLLALFVIVLLHNFIPHTHESAQTGFHHSGHSHGHHHGSYPHEHEHAAWQDVLLMLLHGLRHQDPGPGHFEYFIAKHTSPVALKSMAPFVAVKPDPVRLSAYDRSGLQDLFLLPAFLISSPDPSGESERGPPAFG